MPYPRAFRDDGETLFLDLHGSTVVDALALVRRALAAGARYGRSRVEIVHGYSTSRSPYERTIRNALHDEWDAGSFDAWVADVRWDVGGGRSTMWFKVGLGSTAGRLTMADITGD